MNTNKLAAWLILALLNTPAWAVVTFVGVESGPTAQRWSLAAEKKAFAGTNNVYGRSGYYCLAPGAAVASKPVTGGDITGCNTALLKPDFLAAQPTPMAGTWVNYPVYALVTKPQAASADDTWQIGGISAPASHPATGAGEPTKYADVFTFKLGADARFQLGILVDAFGSANFGADYISIYEDVSQRVVYSATALPRDGVPDLVLFNIEGKAGTTYHIALHRKAGGITGSSLITFDKLSETAAPKAP